MFSPLGPTVGSGIANWQGHYKKRIVPAAGQDKAAVKAADLKASIGLPQQTDQRRAMRMESRPAGRAPPARHSEDEEEEDLHTSFYGNLDVQNGPHHQEAQQQTPPTRRVGVYNIVRAEQINVEDSSYTLNPSEYPHSSRSTTPTIPRVPSYHYQPHHERQVSSVYSRPLTMSTDFGAMIDEANGLTPQRPRRVNQVMEINIQGPTPPRRRHSSTLHLPSNDQRRLSGYSVDSQIAADAANAERVLQSAAIFRSTSVHQPSPIHSTTYLTPQYIPGGASRRASTSNHSTQEDDDEDYITETDSEADGGSLSPLSILADADDESTFTVSVRELRISHIRYARDTQTPSAEDIFSPLPTNFTSTRGRPRNSGVPAETFHSAHHEAIHPNTEATLGLRWQRRVAAEAAAAQTQQPHPTLSHNQQASDPRTPFTRGPFTQHPDQQVLYHSPHTTAATSLPSTLYNSPYDHQRAISGPQAITQYSPVTAEPAVPHNTPFPAASPFIQRNQDAPGIWVPRSVVPEVVNPCSDAAISFLLHINAIRISNNVAPLVLVPSLCAYAHTYAEGLHMEAVRNSPISNEVQSYREQMLLDGCITATNDWLDELRTEEAHSQLKQFAEYRKSISSSLDYMPAVALLLTPFPCLENATSTAKPTRNSLFGTIHNKLRKRKTVADLRAIHKGQEKGNAHLPTLLPSHAIFPEEM